LKLPFKRVLLKLSGETLKGSHGYGIDFAAALDIANSVKKLHDVGLEIGIVIGAGNLFRGLQGAGKGMDRSSADQIGMLATVMNCLSLKQAFKAAKVPVEVLSMVPCGNFVIPFSRDRAVEGFKNKQILIFSGGTGNPFFTTDSAAALKACEIDAEILLKATKVDGVYDKDPVKYPDAVKFSQLSYIEALEKNLKVMDATAIALCRENQIPIKVFNFFTEDILEALSNENCGTLVH